MFGTSSFTGGEKRSLWTTSLASVRKRGADMTFIGRKVISVDDVNNSKEIKNNTTTKKQEINGDSNDNTNIEDEINLKLDERFIRASIGHRKKTSTSYLYKEDKKEEDNVSSPFDDSVKWVRPGFSRRQQILGHVGGDELQVISVRISCPELSKSVHKTVKIPVNTIARELLQKIQDLSRKLDLNKMKENLAKSNDGDTTKDNSTDNSEVSSPKGETKRSSGRGTLRKILGKTNTLSRADIDKQKIGLYITYNFDVIDEQELPNGGIYIQEDQPLWKYDITICSKLILRVIPDGEASSRYYYNWLRIIHKDNATLKRKYQLIRVRKFVMVQELMETINDELDLVEEDLLPYYGLFLCTEEGGLWMDPKLYVVNYELKDMDILELRKRYLGLALVSTPSADFGNKNKVVFLDATDYGRGENEIEVCGGMSVRDAVCALHGWLLPDVSDKDATRWGLMSSSFAGAAYRAWLMDERQLLSYSLAPGDFLEFKKRTSTINTKYVSEESEEEKGFTLIVRFTPGEGHLKEKVHTSHLIQGSRLSGGISSPPSPGTSAISGIAVRSCSKGGGRALLWEGLNGEVLVHYLEGDVHLILSSLTTNTNYDYQSSLSSVSSQSLVFSSSSSSIDNTTIGSLSLSNYSLTFRSAREGESNDLSKPLKIPLATIQRVSKPNKKSRELVIALKTFRPAVRIRFKSREDRKEWQARIITAAFPKQGQLHLFAFYYSYIMDNDGIVYSNNKGGDDGCKGRSDSSDGTTSSSEDIPTHYQSIREEFDRMFRRSRTQKQWRHTGLLNHDHHHFPSYPGLMYVPATMGNDSLVKVSKFRSKARIPVLTYMHSNGASISRCSQPMRGLMGTSCKEDQRLIEELRRTSPAYTNGSALNDVTGGGDGDEAVLRLFDARPKVAAMANQAKGAGTENVGSASSGYSHCTLEFLNIGNIHTMRESYNKLEALCNGITMGSGSGGWLSGLERTRWLEYIQLLLVGACSISWSVHGRGEAVVIHCSDGWDRTSQLSALAQIILDPHYRTLEGFTTLIDKDWLSFGHKFAQRTGHASPDYADSQRAPIFHQFLDCVYQMVVQYPCSFEFCEDLLLFIADELYSCRFGTFLFNNERERHENNVFDKTISIWEFVNSVDNRGRFVNHFYVPMADILFPDLGIHNMHFWSAFYLRWYSTSTHNNPTGETVRMTPQLRGLQQTMIIKGMRERLIEKENELKTLKHLNKYKPLMEKPPTKSPPPIPPIDDEI